jgi:putative tryptophan/tyrosine transport system substrate-binding protein
MRRRDFIVFITGATLLAPVTSNAQEPGRVYRLGVLFASRRRGSAALGALFETLRRHGFVEGQNLLDDPDGYGLRVDQMAEHAAKIVRNNADVIVCTGNAAIRAAQDATKTIPILASTDDLLGSGFVHSMAKPEGNTTGNSILSTELNGKRQEILMEVLPAVRQMAVLADANTYSPEYLQMLRNSARARGVELSVYRLSKPDEITDALGVAKSSGAGAVNVLASPLLYANREIIRERAATLSLPAMYQAPEVVEEGGFIAYGPSVIQLFRDILARQLLALLRGAKVADVPVEQPTKFELAINLKTAKALGLSIPESFLSRADEVIE